MNTLDVIIKWTPMLEGIESSKHSELAQLLENTLQVVEGMGMGRRERMFYIPMVRRIYDRYLDKNIPLVEDTKAIVPLLIVDWDDLDRRCSFGAPLDSEMDVMDELCDNFRYTGTYNKTLFYPV